jgi:restriction system protein
MVQPSFQDVMLPILQIASDGQPHSLREIIEKMEVEFQLTPQEKSERIPSGRLRTIYSRVSWAITHLKKAGLIESSTQRGFSEITESGKNELSENPKSITVNSLKKYPSYLNFVAQNDIINPINTSPKVSVCDQSPEEIIGIKYEELNQQLALDLLDKIQKNDSDFFEQLVVDLLLKMGYGGSEGSGKVTQRSGDGGIDGIIEQDELGLDTIYIQAKRWEMHSAIQQPEIQKFAGALGGVGAIKGVFITTAKFSSGAIQYAQKYPNAQIRLIDGLALAKLMIKYNLGVGLSQSIEIKRIDSDYFEEL